MDSAGAKSTMSRDIEELTTGKEQISKSVQGHKANLSNPSKQPSYFIFIYSQLFITWVRHTSNILSLQDTSEKSKENSREAIEAMGGEAAHYGNIEQPRSKDAADKLEGSRAMATEWFTT